ncbi:MAG: 3-methyl-2-oxobutanoate hydroxymethyltransferase, partial [Victivallaceae bacterium]
MAAKFTVSSFRKMKSENHKIIMLTAYDAISAQMVAQGGVEVILVGDSMANTALGYENTLPLTLDEAIYHARAVRRGAPDTFIIGDMPFGSYNVSKEQAIESANRLLKETMCDCVKLEGGANMAETIHAMVEAGIPVMGHIGMTPQTASSFGGFKVQGGTPE